MISILPLTPQTIQTDFKLIQKNEPYLETFNEGYPDLKTTEDYYRSILSMYGDLEALSMKRFSILSDNNHVGQIGLHSFAITNFTSTAEIFYWIDENFQGKGIVTKACELIQEHAFKVLGVELLIIHCLEANEKSANVALRCKFVYEGLSKFYDAKNGYVQYKKYTKSYDAYMRK